MWDLALEPRESLKALEQEMTKADTTGSQGPAHIHQEIGRCLNSRHIEVPPGIKILPFLCSQALW